MLPVIRHLAIFPVVTDLENPTYGIFPELLRSGKRFALAIDEVYPDAKNNIQTTPIFKHTVEDIDLPTRKVSVEEYCVQLILLKIYKMKNSFSIRRSIYYALTIIILFQWADEPVSSQTISATLPANDCYFKESESNMLLGNAKVEIQINRLSGTITGLMNKTTGVKYLGNGKPDIFRMEYSTFELHGATSKDIWSAGYGTLIYGNKQKVSASRFEKTPTGGKLEVSYDSLDWVEEPSLFPLATRLSLLATMKKHSGE